MNLVRMENIKKRFGPVIALDGVSFEIKKDEIVGLVGDNAAGKSTLMKILTGAYQPDGGEIYVYQGLAFAVPSGREAYVAERVWFRSPEDSRALGIEMVYQDLALVPTLDVAANVFLGRELTRFRLGPIKVLDKRKMTTRAANLLSELNILVKNPREIVEHLSGGQRQAVAIARAVARRPRLVILDEPTAALSLTAIARVHALMLDLKRRNIAVILISHRLDDILDVCNRAVVLYQGRVFLEVDLTRNDRRWNRDCIMQAMEGRATEEKHAN